MQNKSAVSRPSPSLRQLFFRSDFQVQTNDLRVQNHPKSVTKLLSLRIHSNRSVQDFYKFRNDFNRILMLIKTDIAGIKTFAISSFKSKESGFIIFCRFQIGKLIDSAVFIKKMMMKELFINSFEICSFALIQSVFQTIQAFLNFHIHQTSHSTFHRITEDFPSFQLSGFLTFGESHFPIINKFIPENHFHISDTMALSFFVNQHRKFTNGKLNQK